jgi:8-oxo-dGTP pyrophosphatase MutT (NUDIX family)
VGAAARPPLEPYFSAGGNPAEHPAPVSGRVARNRLAARDNSPQYAAERPSSCCRDDPLDWRPADSGRSAFESGRGSVARLSAATATSAGGIVYRFVESTPQLVVGRRKRERDSHTWTLPKGTPNAGETLEETALREVCEETGLTVRIMAPLDSIKYTFVQRGTRIHKTVHYFMMEPTGGGLEGHDREFEEVRWISFDDAATMLSFETERGLVSLAATRLPDRAI